MQSIHVWYRHCSWGIGIIKLKECTFKRYTYIFPCKQPCITSSYLNQNNMVVIVRLHWNDSKEASTITRYTVQLPGTLYNYRTWYTVQIPGSLYPSIMYCVHVGHYLLVNYEEIPLD